MISHSQEQIIRDYGFVPDRLLLALSPSSTSTSFTDVLIRLFSSMFIHANIGHLVFNILALAYLGGYAERSVGSFRYFFIYLAAGVVGALFYGAISTFILGNSHTLLIGASGAISGILGIAAAAGNNRAYYWLLIQIVFAIVGSFTALQIAFTAHIGGFIAGMLLTKVLAMVEYKRRIKYLK
ncbi:MAG TPA: rhomboid family intramembrane serine protease [Nitrososphaeraceae archaeon]